MSGTSLDGVDLSMLKKWIDVRNLLMSIFEYPKLIKKINDYINLIKNLFLKMIVF